MIEVDVKESDGDVTVAVRDSGSGIAPELLPTVFDLFVQSRRTLDRSEGGLGIGLTVVKQLIQLHGGTVSAESAGAGRGTTVTVHLPSVQPAGAPERPAAPSTTPRRRILVVDDNADEANSLGMMLQLEGHEVSTAYSASRALIAAEQLKPEVVFLDIGMPQMDGYEVARRLRAQFGSSMPASGRAHRVWSARGSDTGPYRRVCGARDKAHRSPAAAASAVGHVGRRCYGDLTRQECQGAMPA